MRYISLSLLVSMLILSAHSHAEESAEGGGAGADREWAKRTSKLNVLDAKMKELTKKIKGFIASKKAGVPALDEKGKPIDVLEAIVSTHKQLKETVGSYGKENDELQYRFPEKGELIKAKYVPLRIQSLEQIEKEMGLDGELTRTKKKIDKKYSSFVGDDLVQPPPQAPAAAQSTLKETKPSGDEPKRLKLSQ